MPNTVMQNSTPLSANGNINISPLASTSSNTVTTANTVSVGYPVNYPYYLTSNSVLTTSHSTPASYSRISDILTIKDGNGKPLVKIDHAGKVVWDEDILIDEAASALGGVFELSVEIAAKITLSVKQRIRNTVFEEIISLANSKGTLTADDLTYLYQAAKIMDKLKGGND